MLPFHVIRRFEKTFNFINSKCQPDLPSPITKSCHSETHPDVSRDAQGWKLQHFPAQSISMFASGKVQTGYWEQILHRAVVGYWNRLPKGSDSTEPAGDQEVFEQHSQKYSFILRWSCVEPGAELNDPVHSTVHCWKLRIFSDLMILDLPEHNLRPFPCVLAAITWEEKLTTTSLQSSFK